MIINAGKKACQKKQQQNSRSPRKRKENTNIAIEIAITQSYMPEQDLMPYNLRNIKEEVVKTMTPHANYVEKKRKT